MVLYSRVVCEASFGDGEGASRFLNMDDFEEKFRFRTGHIELARQRWI